LQCMSPLMADFVAQVGLVPAISGPF